MRDKLYGNKLLDKRCAAQDEQFNLIFAIAVAIKGVLLVLTGSMYDKLGTLTTRLLGSVIFLSGSLMIAFSKPAIPYVLYPAVLCVMYGGFFILMTNMQLGNLLKRGRNTLICIMNGAFDSSAFVLLLIKVAYEAGISLKASFLTISAIYSICILSTFLWLPRQFILDPLPDDFHLTICSSCKRNHGDYAIEVKSDLEISNINETQTQDPNEESGETVESTDDNAPNTPGDSPQPFSVVIQSPMYWTSVLWFSSTHLRLMFFLGNFNSWITNLTKNNAQNVSMYTTVFSFMLFAAVIMGPLSGPMLDRRTTAPIGSLAFKLEKIRHFIPMFYLNTGLGVLLSACAAIPVLELQYFTFVVFVLHRTFNYGPASAFLAQAFPSQHFGKLYGIMFTTGAIVSLLQYPLFIWIKGPLRNDSMWVHIILICLAAMSIVHPINVWLYCRTNASRIRMDSKYSKVKDMHRETNHIQQNVGNANNITSMQ
ncbi:unnamed protein product [Owenia fusiformis]|uniref:Solute carrier family 43 member 3 n=1 Tax=Owenia fusiformis TaxID=6347 RepID=A0A8S4Q4X9_OWEFU|nr:unnamed protein product [Owenia fusiformis]